MIPVIEESKSKIIGNIDTDRNVTIKNDPFVYHILSEGIYTDGVKAVIREYACNALDSHIMAKNDKPFDVFLPSTLDPTFRVRDYGTGLSYEDAVDVFGTYFESRKRECNEQIGAIGIGCFAAYSVASTYTVKSYFNGKVYSFQALKDSDDFPKFIDLCQEDTDEPNGVEIIIPIKAGDNYKFESKAVDVFKHFKQIPNINKSYVVSKIKEYKQDISIETDDYLIRDKVKYSENLKVLMGNILYNIKDCSFVPSTLSYLTKVNLILKMPLGSCAFSPSREDLRLNDKTKASVLSHLQVVEAALKADVEDKVKDAKNFYDASIQAQTFKGIFPRIDEIKWKGKKLQKKQFKTKAISYSSTYLSKGLECEYPVYDTGVEYYWNKQGYVERIRQYLRQYGNKIHKVILIEKEHVAQIGFDDSYVKDLDSLPAASKSTSKTASTYNPHKTFTWNGGTRSGTSTTYNDGAKNNWDNKTIDLSSKDELVYVQLSFYEPVGSKIRDCSTLAQLKKLCESKNITFPTIHGIKTSFTKTNKFKKAKFISLHDYIIREWKKLKKADKTFSKRDKGSHDNDILSLVGKVKCPLFKNIFQSKKPELTYYLKSLLNSLALDYNTCTKDENTIQIILQKYPLIKSFNSYYNNSNELAAMVDAIYSVNKRKKVGVTK